MNNKKKSKITPIKQELRPLLEEFLMFEPYQELFLMFANSLGYPGKDMARVKQLLFTVKGTDIGFNIMGLHDLFLEFQLLKQLTDKEPYKTLLEEYPQSIHNIRELAKHIFSGKPVTEMQLTALFDVKTYEVREEILDEKVESTEP